MGAVALVVPAIATHAADPRALRDGARPPVMAFVPARGTSLAASQLVLLLPLEAEADATGHRGRAWLADWVRSRPTGGPINGRLGHLRGTALGFRNLTRRFHGQSVPVT